MAAIGKGPGVQQVHRNTADGAVCSRAQPELAGGRLARQGADIGN